MQWKLLMCRRDFFGLTAGLTAASVLAQDASRPAIVLRVAVTDRQGRYINGLKPSDFRVFEDDILQTISNFDKSPQVMNEDRATKPLADGKPAGESGKPGSDKETFESIREDLVNSYIITYHPDPSNHNAGFRKIKVEIVADIGRSWRVRHRPGYRPDNRIPSRRTKDGSRFFHSGPPQIGD